MTRPAISRAQVRALLDDHLRRQAGAHVDGRWYAVQNDINDELNDAAGYIGARFGAVEAERFLRLYAEEQLAFERDMRANPRQAAARFYPDEFGPGVVVQAQLPAPSKPSIAPLLLFCFIIGGILAALL